MPLAGNGLFEPNAQHIYRVLNNWRRQMQLGIGPAMDATLYREKSVHDYGKMQRIGAK